MAMAKCSRCGTSVEVTPVGTERLAHCPICREGRALYRCFTCMKHTLLASGTQACPYCNTRVRPSARNMAQAAAAHAPIVPPPLEPPERLATREALWALKTKPLAFLAKTRVMAGGFQGTDSKSGRMCVALRDNELRIGPDRFVASAPQNSVVTCQVIYTPMRDNDMMTGRTAATQRLKPDNNELWVTTRLTGCTVLVLDWEDLGYSMVHLRPHKTEDFNSLLRYLFEKSDSVKASTKNYYLRQEATAVAHATGAGVAPRRYLLVQSNYTAAAGRRLNIIGVRNGPGWDFYSQIEWRGAYTPQLLQWQVWSRFRPYVAGHF